jgi:quinolinate synthase
MSPLQEEILALKKKKNAVILAHNYQVREIQEIADYVGDSLGLSYQAQARRPKSFSFAAFISWPRRLRS